MNLFVHVLICLERPPLCVGIRSLRLVAVGAVASVVAGLFSAVAAPHAAALDNGLALTPPMGFNDWNAFGCNVDEQLIKQTADLFVSSGLKAAGYEYVNIDDCWLEKQRSATGHLVPDPVKFPDGIKGTANYVHSKGLKLGIYEDAGTETCAGYPGSLGHEQTDANDFADMGRGLPQVRQLQQPERRVARGLQGAVSRDAGRARGDRTADRVQHVRMGRQPTQRPGRPTTAICGARRATSVTTGAA